MTDWLSRWRMDDWRHLTDEPPYVISSGAEPSPDDAADDDSPGDGDQHPADYPG